MPSLLHTHTAVMTRTEPGVWCWLIWCHSMCVKTADTIAVSLSYEGTDNQCNNMHERLEQREADKSESDMLHSEHR